MSRKRRSLPPLSLILLLLAAPLLGGCLGGADGEGEDQAALTKQRADVNDRLGGVEGVVTDEAIQPFEGANVTLEETGTSVRTDTDGSFAFSLLEPGTYTISVRGQGLVSSQQIIDVTAGEITPVDFILTRTFTDQPFTQQQEWAAFIECGAATSNPVFSLTVAVCSVPNSVLEEVGLGGNATNDEFITSLEFEAPLETLVWEAKWSGGGPLANSLWMAADIQGHAQLTSGNWTVFVDTAVESPFLTRVNRTTLDEISAFFSEECEAGGDSYCGYAFEEQGWPITFRTFTSPDCLPGASPVSACTPIQLRVDHVFTSFYNAPAPEGYSVYGSDA